MVCDIVDHLELFGVAPDPVEEPLKLPFVPFQHSPAVHQIAVVQLAQNLESGGLFSRIDGICVEVLGKDLGPCQKRILCQRLRCASIPHQAEAVYMIPKSPVSAYLRHKTGACLCPEEKFHQDFYAFPVKRLDHIPEFLVGVLRIAVGRFRRKIISTCISPIVYLLLP